MRRWISAPVKRGSVDYPVRQNASNAENHVIPGKASFATNAK